MQMAGDNFVTWSGVFLYCSIARWKLSTLISPFFPTLSVMSRLMVLTPNFSSAIAMREGYRAKSVMDAPIAKEFPGEVGYEFWSAICC